MVHRDEQRSSALRAERSLPEAARPDAADQIRARGHGEIAARTARTCLRRGAPVERAMAAMAPSAIERLALQFVSNSAAQASTGHSHTLVLPLTTARPLLTSPARTFAQRLREHIALS